MIYLLVVTFLLTPAYIIKLKVGSLPGDILMLWVLAVWFLTAVIFSLNKKWKEFFGFFKNLDKKLLILVGLFLLSGAVSLLIGGTNKPNLGQFLVLFLQPISVFFLAAFTFGQKDKYKEHFLGLLYIFLGLAGLYALVQYVTLAGLPAAYQGNLVEPKRALSFFDHPNFYALFSAPLLALLIPDLAKRIELGVGKNLLWIGLWVLGGVGLLVSLSRAGWLGLAAAILVYLIFAADKKVRLVAVIAIVLAIAVGLSIGSVRERLVAPFHGEKSATSRLTLWKSGLKGIKESPVFGLGLNGFAEKYANLISDPSLDTHNFPHNIFLNFWVETGLLGLISFMGLSSLYIYRGLKAGVTLNWPKERQKTKRKTLTLENIQTQDKLIKLGIALFFIALITQGIIDNPYFKNDLAMVFWLILALNIYEHTHKKTE